MKVIKITTAYGKYQNYVGQTFQVYDFIDNNGCYTLLEDRGQPFMSVHQNYCIEI